MPGPFDVISPLGKGDHNLSDKEMLHKIAKKVVDMGLSVPAILFLEMGKPLSFIGSQTMVFFAPIATAVLPGKGYTQLAGLLEERENVEALMCEIERLEDENSRNKKRNKGDGRNGRGGRRRWFSRKKDAAAVRDDSETKQ